ncbi:PIN domain-like protein [Auricularia subglabra TFB-10046 SS5]|nr:PIN domain-like protein [Auricularia subglabra TFB-10046 SS5]
MGVHGLTTYLRENRRTVSKTLHLSLATSAEQEQSITAVVDAWSFIYSLYYQSGLPWIYGGELDAFEGVITQTVNAWRAVGMQPVFVFDGPSPPAKFATTIERTNKGRVEPSLIFFRTSAAGRASTRFLADPALRMLPPLAHTACVRALLRAGVPCHFADSEADPFAVELAGALGAYVVANDSDFVVLRPGGDGYRGYIPLDEMAWAYPPPPAEPVVESADADFLPMKSPRRRMRRKSTMLMGHGLIPLPTFDGLSLTVYTPDALAAQLHIPVPLLPVLAAFVGCDFASFQRMFFDRGLSLSQRITRTAQTLSPLVAPGASTRRTKYPSTVMDLVNSMITSLLVRPIDSDEQESIAGSIVDAILQYSIMDITGPLSPTSDCLLHHPSECELLQALNVSSRNAEQKATLRNYIAAFRSGSLAPEVMDIVFSGSYWPTVFLENPDLESTSKFIGRPIRQFMYAVLNHDVGLFDPDVRPTPSERHALSGDYQGVGSSSVSGMSSALEEEIDLEGSEGEPSPTSGKLHVRPAHIDTTDSSIDSIASSSFVHLTASSTSLATSVGPISIKEYVRRGGHVGPQDVPVPPLDELIADLRPSLDADLPDAVHARPERVRLLMLLTALHSNTERVRSLEPDVLVPVVVLRWVIRTMGERPQLSERWQRQEAQAVLASLLTSTLPEEAVDTPVQAEPRNVQLVAQLLAALEATLHLGQTLFLADHVTDVVARFSGKRAHTLLTLKRGGAHAAGDAFNTCWAAIVDGQNDLFAGEAKKSARREKKALQLQNPAVSTRTRSGSGGARSPATARRSMFEVLADMEE